MLLNVVQYDKSQGICVLPPSIDSTGPTIKSNFASPDVNDRRFLFLLSCIYVCDSIHNVLILMLVFAENGKMVILPM